MANVKCDVFCVFFVFQFAVFFPMVLAIVGNFRSRKMPFVGNVRLQKCHLLESFVCELFKCVGFLRSRKYQNSNLAAPRTTQENASHHKSNHAKHRFPCRVAHFQKLVCVIAITGTAGGAEHEHEVHPFCVSVGTLSLAHLSGGAHAP